MEGEGVLLLLLFCLFAFSFFLWRRRICLYHFSQRIVRGVCVCFTLHGDNLSCGLHLYASLAD